MIQKKSTGQQPSQTPSVPRETKLKPKSSFARVLDFGKATADNSGEFDAMTPGSIERAARKFNLDSTLRNRGRSRQQTPHRKNGS